MYVFLSYYGIVFQIRSNWRKIMNRSYNQYGSFVAPDNTQARLDMPTMSELGGKGAVPWVRVPFYPTAPFTSTNVNVGTQTRFYGATLLSTDADYTIGSESIRTIQFDIPCRLIAINGACVNVTVAGGAGTFSDNNGNNNYLFRLEYTTGDKLMTAGRVASTVVGSAERPAEIGGTGYTIDQGASVVLGITPLGTLTGLTVRIDITLVCLEIRGNRNFIG